MNPNSAETYQKLGVLLSNLRWFDDAILIFDQAIQINPNLAEVYYFKGQTLFEQGNLQESILMFDKAINIQPAIAEFYFHKGVSFQGLQNYTEALQLYNQAIQINPNYTQAQLKIDTCLFLVNDQQLAHQIQKQQKYYSYGDIYFKLGQLDQAILMYFKANEITQVFQKEETSLGPGNQENPMNFLDQQIETDTDTDIDIDTEQKTIILSNQEIHSPDNQIDVIDDNILINPNCVQSLIMKANIHYLFGQNDKAQKLYDRALSKINDQIQDNKKKNYGNPNTLQNNARLKAVSLFMKGRIYQSQGRHPEADQYYIYSCQLNPSLCQYQYSDMIPSLYKKFNN